MDQGGPPSSGLCGGEGEGGDEGVSLEDGVDGGAQGAATLSMDDPKGEEPLGLRGFDELRDEGPDLGGAESVQVDHTVERQGDEVRGEVGFWGYAHGAG